MAPHPVLPSLRSAFEIRLLRSKGEATNRAKPPTRDSCSPTAPAKSCLLASQRPRW